MKSPFKKKRISISGLCLSRLPCEFLGVCILLVFVLSLADVSSGNGTRSPVMPDISDLDYTYSYKLNKGVKNPSFRNSKNYNDNSKLSTTSLSRLSSASTTSATIPTTTSFSRNNSSYYTSVIPYNSYYQDFFSASPSSVRRNRVPVR